MGWFDSTDKDAKQADYEKGQEDGSKSGLLDEIKWIADFTKSEAYDKGFANGTKNRRS